MVDIMTVRFSITSNLSTIKIYTTYFSMNLHLSLVSPSDISSSIEFNVYLEPYIQSYDFLEPPRSPAIQHDHPNDTRASTFSPEMQKLAEREAMVQKDIISALNAGILIGTEGGNCGVLDNLAKKCGFMN